ncbi:hypothetical protein PCE1_002566 [Barthelona sp. PCE]
MERAFNSQDPYNPDFNLTKQVYYAELLHFCLENMLIFPYHLWEDMLEVRKITPTMYYSDMIVNLVLTDYNYAHLPNFTANDIKRVINVSRNEFIDLIQASKSRFGIFKNKTKGLKNLIPETQPFAAFDDMSDLKYLKVCGMPPSMVSSSILNNEESVFFDLLKDNAPTSIPIRVLSAMYIKNVIRIDYVVTKNALFITDFDSFVMNTSSESLQEKLLYRILMVLDGRTSVQEVAIILDESPVLIKRYVSLLWRMRLIRRTTPVEMAKLNCLVVDSSLTSLLMVNNFGTDLIPFAVRLFEAGRIFSNDIRKISDALQTIEEPHKELLETELGVCYRKLVVLREFLRTPFAQELDIINLESIDNLQVQERAAVLSMRYSSVVLLEQAVTDCIPLPIVLGGAFPRSLRLYTVLDLYRRMGHVSKGALIPCGIQLEHIPDVVEQDDIVLLRTKDSFNVHITDCSNFLVDVNSRLLTSALLLTVHPANTYIINVAFPVLDDFVYEVSDIETVGSSAHDVVDIPLKDSTILEIKGLISTIEAKVPITTNLGYIRFTYSITQSGYSIKPFDIIFGLALFSQKFSDHATKAFAQLNMLDKDHLAESHKQTMVYVDKLKTFVSQQKYVNSTFDSTTLVSFGL